MAPQAELPDTVSGRLEDQFPHEFPVSIQA
ncbi:hypothetical protein SAMN06272737_118123 [Blastococcus mobilis]|uniref:Uncharacterized protein n=1 Tax=Blastococcus mobilis TaxID=1938746 RepID=A0A238YAI9_9ACTN|nr:hypothetical protein SAMN06272737_118123 [Blastococcus mobilis]